MAGIYLHIPFCKQACSYCDFYFTTRLTQREDFVAALLTEIALQKDFFQSPVEIQSLYFGGGTPSLLSIASLRQILEKLHHTFTIVKEAEITLEVNPDDLNLSILSEWKSLGINRLSLGLQSVAEKDLRLMHRAHTADQAIHSVELIRKAGFENFTLDLIYGIPGAGMEGWRKNLQFLQSVQAPHFSAYALTVESRTRLHKEIQLGKTKAPNEEEMIEQFVFLQEFAANNDYEAYEISNYAKIGKKAIHNSSYWYQKPYLGLGPSAHSYISPRREANPSNLKSYLERLSQNHLPEKQIETLSQKDQVNELIMTRLRLSAGLPSIEYQSIAGHTIEERCEDIIKNFNNSGLLVQEAGNWKLTQAGRLQADGIAAELFW